MNIHTFSPIERGLAFLASFFNLIIGLAFLLLPELHIVVWPTPIPALLTRFIGAIILGNAAGAFWLGFEREWARVRPLAIVAVVYGTLAALALLYHLLWLKTPTIFWLYFLCDMPFLIIFYVLFIYHDLIPLITGSTDR